MLVYLKKKDRRLQRVPGIAAMGETLVFILLSKSPTISQDMAFCQNTQILEWRLAYVLIFFSFHTLILGPKA